MLLFRHCLTITVGRKVDIVLWWARLFPHLCTDHVVYEHNTLLPVWRSDTGTQVLCICAARPSKTLNSQLEAELKTYVQGNSCHMVLSSLPWVFLAFIFSGRDGSKYGYKCSGWKDCTQAHGTSHGLGEERRIGEKKAYHDFNLVFLWVLN